MSKRTHSGQRIMLIIYVAGKTGKIMKIDYYSTSYIKINSKVDLNVRSETLKFLQENIGSNLTDFCCRDVYEDVIPKKRDAKINN